MTEATGSCSVKKRCSDVYFCLGIWGVLDSAKSENTGKIRCSVKSLPSFVGYWRALDYNLEANSKQPGKIRYWILVKIYIFSWDNMAFLCDISLLPEKKKLFFFILQKRSLRGVLWPATLLKKRLWRRCFPLSFVKFLRTLFLREHLRWLFPILTISHLNRGGFLFTYFIWISWNQIKCNEIH